MIHTIDGIIEAARGGTRGSSPWLPPMTSR